MSSEPDDLDGLGHLLSLSRQLESPPAWASRRAEALWRSRGSAQSEPAAWRRIVAELVDSLTATPLQLGLRGQGGGVRQWIYHADAHDIELRLRPDPTRPESCWELSGQVLGPQSQGMLQLVSASSEQPPCEQPLDPLGSFQFSGLGAGQWQLLVSLIDRRIELPLLTWPSDDAA